MDEIEIKITFEDNLAGCEITKGDNIAHLQSPGSDEWKKQHGFKTGE